MLVRVREKKCSTIGANYGPLNGYVLLKLTQAQIIRPLMPFKLLNSLLSNNVYSADITFDKTADKAIDTHPRTKKFPIPSIQEGK